MAYPPDAGGTWLLATGDRARAREALRLHGRALRTPGPRSRTGSSRGSSRSTGSRPPVPRPPPSSRAGRPSRSGTRSGCSTPPTGARSPSSFASRPPRVRPAPAPRPPRGARGGRGEARASLPRPVSLGRLLRPHSVAFVGGAIAARSSGRVRGGRLDRPVYAVHPRGELGGRPRSAASPSCPRRRTRRSSRSMRPRPSRSCASSPRSEPAGPPATRPASPRREPRKAPRARTPCATRRARCRCSARTAMAPSTSSAAVASGRCPGRTNGVSVASPSSSRAATSAST